MESAQHVRHPLVLEKWVDRNLLVWIVDAPPSSHTSQVIIVTVCQIIRVCERDSWRIPTVQWRRYIFSENESCTYHPVFHLGNYTTIRSNIASTRTRGWKMNMKKVPIVLLLLLLSITPYAVHGSNGRRRAMIEPHNGGWMVMEVVTQDDLD